MQLGYVSEGRAKGFAGWYDKSSSTPDQIISWLKEYEAAGPGDAIVNFADVAYDRGSLEPFAKKVIRAFG